MRNLNEIFVELLPFFIFGTHNIHWLPSYCVQFQLKHVFLLLRIRRSIFYVYVLHVKIGFCNQTIFIKVVCFTHGFFQLVGFFFAIKPNKSAIHNNVFSLFFIHRISVDSDTQSNEEKKRENHVDKITNIDTPTEYLTHKRNALLQC